MFEWVADVYRPLTNNEVSDMNYFRGNIFESYITEDGKISLPRISYDIIQIEMPTNNYLDLFRKSKLNLKIMVTKMQII